MGAVRPRKGMQLFDADGALIGMIDGARGNSVTVHGRPFPKGAIARVKENRAYLKSGVVLELPRAATAKPKSRPPVRAKVEAAAPVARRAPGRRTGRAPIVPLDPREERRLLARSRREEREAVGQEALVVPLAEERLQVEKRRAELGEVAVRKTVVEERQTVPVELEREEVRVEFVDTRDRLALQDAGLFQEGVIRLPVHGEEAVVQKEAVITGEAVIAKERVAERRQIADTVRVERVAVVRQAR
jgi:uncharacterized protein (TIGR02271 family)